MDQEAIRRHIASEYEGVDVVVSTAEGGGPEISWGDSFFIYDPQRNLEGPRRFPFATIVTKDYGDFDNASKLDREGVFRLNIGVTRETFERLFRGVEEHDFTALDRVMPHPVYAVNHWICVLNPSEDTFASLKPLLDEAYKAAVKRAGPRKR